MCRNKIQLHPNMYCSKYLVLLCIFALSKSDNAPPDLLSVWLYDDLNQTQPINLMQADLSIININTTKPTAFICQDWTNIANVSWYNPMIQALLLKGYNVLASDWSNYSRSLYFLQAAPDTNPVGAAFGNLTVNLRNTLNVSLGSFHCIGYSLGAHICGFLGQTVNQTAGEKIGRITGLDPAGPSFNLANSSHCLSKNDTMFLDVIHTNAGLTGIIASIGHIDFWPNGGSVQLLSCIATFPNYIPFCSHQISAIYFIESISSRNFTATVCESYRIYLGGGCRGNEEAIIGLNVNTGHRGDYYLSITTRWSIPENLEPPFADGITFV